MSPRTVARAFRLPGLACALALPAAATAQVRARGAPHPAQLASFDAVAPSVRAFDVARADDRAVIAWVEGADVRARGTLRSAMFRARADGAGIERVGSENVLAPNTVSAAVDWDGTHGAVVYVVPVPHRGHPPHPHSRRAPPTGPDPLEDPLGPLSISAGDVVLQLLDANGAPAGRPVTVFRENSRAYRVAVARDGDGWLVAWTGSLSTDGESRGTVRWSRVGPAGEVRSFASDTGFTGHVGDAMHIAPGASSDGRADPWLLFSGERCVARPDLPDNHPPTNDPSADIEGHNRPLNAQAPAHEVWGPPVVCATRHVYLAAMHGDGTTGAVLEGPALATDAFSANTLQGGALGIVASVGERPANGALTLVTIDAHGATAESTLLQGVAGDGASSSGATAAGDEANSARGATPSSVPPPRAPGPDDIARAPIALAARVHGSAVDFAAVSPTHARMVLGSRAEGARSASFTLLAPGPRVFDVALAPGSGASAWVFARTGSEADGVLMGPLVYFDTAAASAHAATAETLWEGDDRFRVQLLRVRATRAAYTESEQTYMWAASRPDAATNAHLATMAQHFNGARARWQNACGGLSDRARWLVAHGVDASINDLVRQSCDAPPEVVPPSAAAAAGAAPPAP